MNTTWLRFALRKFSHLRIGTLTYVVGNVAGMAVCGFALMYVSTTLSFDRFHEKSDRIYRVIGTFNFGGDPFDAARMPAPLGPTLEQEFPEVQRFTRLREKKSAVIRPAQFEQQPIHSRVVFADSSFFDVFSFRLVKGDPSAVLSAPQTAVLTESTAQNLFPNRPAIGQIIEYVGSNSSTYRLEVRGVVSDPPSNSSIQFDVLTSFATLRDIESSKLDDWNSTGYSTYLQLPTGGSVNNLRKDLSSVIGRRTNSEMVDRIDFQIEPLSEVHFSSAGAMHAHGDAGEFAVVVTFGILACILLCANGASVTAVQQSRRQREFGVRKMLGARSADFAVGLLVETVAVSLAAWVLAYGVLAASLSSVQFMLPSTVGIEIFTDPIVGLGGLGIALLVAAFSGLYPIIQASDLHVSNALRGQGTGDRQTLTFRRALIGGQFVISFVLVAGAIVSHQQLEYVQSKELGLSPSQRLVLSLPENSTRGKTATALAQRLREHAGISTVTISSSVPTEFIPQTTVRAPGTDDEMRFAVMKVDSSFARTHNIDRLRGRSFAMDARSYDGPSILINETAAELLGWEKPVGRSISYGGREGRIIGVVEDFHLTSLRKSIPPLILRPAHATGGYLTAHLTKEDVRSTLAFVEESWATMFPSRPFDFFFLDRAFDALYRSEKRIAHAVRWLAALTLLVAGMGLFGMAASVANLRMKEVSIRRALGATGWEVLRLLLKQILTPVAAGCVVAVPIAYALLHEWLSQFAYRIALRPSFFVITVILTIGAALLAVAYPSFRAIRSDPSQLLRQEA